MCVRIRETRSRLNQIETIRPEVDQHSKGDTQGREEVYCRSDGEEHPPKHPQEVQLRREDPDRDQASVGRFDGRGALSNWRDRMPYSRQASPPPFTPVRTSSTTLALNSGLKLRRRLLPISALLSWTSYALSAMCPEKGVHYKSPTS